MKKLSIFFIAATLFLFGCGGVKVSLGDFNFTAPASWTISGQTSDKLEVAFDNQPFVIEYAVSSKEAVEDLPLAIGGEIKVYEVGKCDGFLCYGLVSGNTAAILTFTESSRSSDSLKYDVMEDAISFVKSASF